MAIYDRQAAVNYANHYWNKHNPTFRRFQDDCTSFISQCLWAGGIPMTRSRNPAVGWWYHSGRSHRWSYSWAVANSLYWYLRGKHSTGPQAVLVKSPKELKLGDVICYDWQGDGVWNHNTIVTAFDYNGDPLVNAHTVNSYQRYWEYRDSSAWTPKIKYAFFHITS
ncbi:Putative amidase domain-containing protein [Thermoflavimicrobium dichotomicum]|uniref:Putative amidase domain-containing protein n=1 Tax=Thermoflavimicrobium dichotomicum TaxID=46223 RepID=A0A1I3LIF9_9BACL|nr:Putative amidase domain-containing protein [Thermoflavimicrobium dichotomicum]